MKRIAILIVSVLVYSHLLSQIGGTRTYRFLDIPMTARAAALGGNSMSIWGNDVNLMYSNPAALNSTMSKQIALNYCNYVGDMNFGYLAYAHDLKKYGTVGGGIQFLDYGSFKGYDEFGEATKDFKANDYSINLNYAKPFEDSTFQIGIALKTLISQYDIYQSYGNAIDFGITYHTSKNFVFTVLAKNVGFIWKDYSANRQTREVLPQTVQLGMSYKVSKAPFRLIAVYDNLLKWNLKYISPLDTAGQTNPFDTDKDVADSTE
ncbi:MAG: type IX secretion system protein PorQ, partial [Bacteroidia bacterium]